MDSNKFVIGKKFNRYAVKIEWVYILYNTISPTAKRQILIQDTKYQIVNILSNLAYY